MTSNVVKILDISGVTNQINLDLFCPNIQREDMMAVYGKKGYNGNISKKRVLW